jgi:hypothetical protein
LTVFHKEVAPNNLNTEPVGIVVGGSVVGGTVVVGGRVVVVVARVVVVGATVVVVVVARVVVVVRVTVVVVGAGRLVVVVPVVGGVPWCRWNRCAWPAEANGAASSMTMSMSATKTAGTRRIKGLLLFAKVI